MGTHRAHPRGDRPHRRGAGTGVAGARRAAEGRRQPWRRPSRAAGGGEKGRAAVADRVAYTWFNRIIALRFMDANGYTGIGVVSPQAGVEVGQPEILAEAKRGNIDAEVVGDEDPRDRHGSAQRHPPQ